MKLMHKFAEMTPDTPARPRVEQVQIRDEVFFVVDRQHRIGRRGIGNIRVKRRLLHGRSRSRSSSIQFAFGRGILMTAKPRSPLCSNERTSPVRVVSRSRGRALRLATQLTG